MALLVLVLLILGLFCFLLATAGIGLPRISFGWLGLALWILTVIITTWPK